MRRSFAKAITWRVIAFTITSATAWVLTGRVDIGLGIGLVDSVIKLAAYYAHERAWLRVRRGRKPPSM